MRFLKTYEYMKNDNEYTINDFNVGDYVLIQDDYLFGSSNRQLKIYINFLKNNVGQITYVNNSKEWIEVKFINILPYQISNFFNNNTARYKIYNVIEYSNSIEKLKSKIQGKKYNL